MSQFFTRSLAGFLGLLALLSLAACDAATTAVSLPNPRVDAPLTPGRGPQTAVLAGGCFWGVEGVFQHVKGVLNVTAGYSGGDVATAHYETVSTGTTGHAESVRITYDPSRISYGRLLKVFFAVAHDPTELNRQGPDTGTQYRSAVFYSNNEQRRVARDYIRQLERDGSFKRPIVTQVTPLKAFYPAEAYHQDYLIRHPHNPYIVINDLPKIENLRRDLPNLYVAKPAGVR